jgi:hypothetical protein
VSLAIEVDHVEEVLLADGWHPVTKNSDGVSTFSLDSYEFVWEAGGDPNYLLHGGGRSGVCATGFSFRETAHGARISGPLTAILAVRHK